MIRLQDLTPNVYYKKSRDFQFIGRLYDLVLNYVKTNSDQIYNIPLSDNLDERLLDLLTMTLGFKSKHNYNTKQLISLCSAFVYIIRNKGNINSIETACNALLHAEGISEEVYVEIDSENFSIDIYIPEKLSDTNLIKDLFNYIIPAGMSANVIETAVIQSQPKITTLKHNDTWEYSIKKDYETSKVFDTSLISTIYDPRQDQTEENPYGSINDASGFIINSTIVNTGFESTTNSGE